MTICVHDTIAKLQIILGISIQRNQFDMSIISHIRIHCTSNTLNIFLCIY